MRQGMRSTIDPTNFIAKISMFYRIIFYKCKEILVFLKK